MTFMSPLLGRRKETLNRIAAALQTTAANDDPWIAPAEIADQLSLSLSYTRSLLKELESEGLARRQRDDDDRQIIIWTWNGPSHA